MLTTSPVRTRRRRRGERGLSLVLSALLMLSLLGVSSLAVDLGAWQVEASNQQTAADAAALAGVVRLPDGDPPAIARALAVAADNGYVHGAGGVTVDVVVVNREVIRVTITNSDIPQYFSSLFRDAPTIVRTSTAQYVQPVPLGSPRNYLGTGDRAPDWGVSGDGIENFWLAMSGPCTRREFGDRIATLTMAIPSGAYSCDSAASPRRPNPEYSANGYLFGVEVPAAAAATSIQMLDAPVCTAAAGVVGDENGAAFSTTVTVRNADDINPFAGSVRATFVFPGDANCTAGPANGMCTPGALKGCWTVLDSNLGPGLYYVQVQTQFTSFTANTRHNHFALRAQDGGVFNPCTSDGSGAAGPSPVFRADCPQVFGFEHLPIFANLSTADPVFFLASVDSRHNGKTFEVILYDSAEGATGIELLDPLGNPVTFSWEILCSNGASAASAPCPDPMEQNPAPPGRTGPDTNLLNVSGTVPTAQRTFSVNTQDGRYSDRLIRLRVDLPADIAAAYGGGTWWKIRYSCASCGDRTTWSVRLLGDPVRLIPN